VPRQARLDAPGTLHHVIVRGIERRRIVDDELDRRKFVHRVGEMCQKHKVTLQELRLGSRRGRTAQARAEIIQRLVKRHGLPLAEIARQVGISTSGVSRSLSRLQQLST